MKPNTRMVAVQRSRGYSTRPSLMPEDVERTAQVFDLLLGDDLQGRKSHIADNGYKYLELADIS